jgi:hypothetical protein
MAKDSIDSGVSLPPAEPAGSRVGRKGSVVKMMEDRAREIKESRAVQVPDDDAFRTAYPQLWQLFTVTRLSERWERNPPAITITLDGSLWRVTYRDNALSHAISVAASTFAELLPRLDAATVNPEAWSRFRPRGRGLRDVPTKK